METLLKSLIVVWAIISVVIMVSYLVVVLMGAVYKLPFLILWILLTVLNVRNAFKVIDI